MKKWWLRGCPQCGELMGVMIYQDGLAEHSRCGWFGFVNELWEEVVETVAESK